MAPQVQLRSCESRPFRRFGESARHMTAIPGMGRMGADETAINQRDFGMLKYRFLADMRQWVGLPVSAPFCPS
jgi:hypothetical protein